MCSTSLHTPISKNILFRDILKRVVSCWLAVMTTLLFTPAVPAVAEEQQLALRIPKLTVSESEIGEDRLLSVDISVEGNEKGFLAAEFGIAFDSRLALQSIQPCCDAARSFSFTSTSENHMIWFSGASVEAKNTATEGKTQMFTLDFVLPQDYQVGDEYIVTYEWNGVDGSPGFWYVDQQTDVLESLMAYSRAGSISIPAQNAPRLNKTSLELNPGSSYALTVENSTTEGVWFSDNESIAIVENGIITGIAPGSCVVSVFLGDASSLLSCDVTVRSEYLYSMFDTEQIRITSSDQVVRLEYPNEIGYTQWISTNPNVVTVEDGILTPLYNGTAQIIATNNGVSKLKTVTVQFSDATEPSTETTTESTTAPTIAPANETTTEMKSEPTTELTTELTTETTIELTSELPTEPASETTELSSETSTETTAETTTASTPETTTEIVTETTTETTTASAARKCGDLNGDDATNILDVIVLNKNLLGTIQLTPEQCAAADVYHDGKVNGSDSLYLLKYVLELIQDVPVEPN